MNTPRVRWIAGSLGAMVLMPMAWGMPLDRIRATEAGAMGAASLIGRTPGPDATLTLSVQAEDQAYWSAQGVSDPPAPSDAHLDQFGSTADRENAAHATVVPAAVAVSASAGTIAITLANAGINRVDLAAPNDTRTYRLTLTNAAEMAPTALIINVTGDARTVSSWNYDVRPLGPGAILFNFPASASASLEALIPDPRLLARWANIDMSGNEIGGAPLPYNALGRDGLRETDPTNPP